MNQVKSITRVSYFSFFFKKHWCCMNIFFIINYFSIYLLSLYLLFLLFKLIEFIKSDNNQNLDFFFCFFKNNYITFTSLFYIKKKLGRQWNIEYHPCSSFLFFFPSKKKNLVAKWDNGIYTSLNIYMIYFSNNNV